MTSYSVTTIAIVETRKLLILLSTDGTPQVSVYDDHLGQTLLRPCKSNVDNLTLAMSVLINGPTA